MSKAVFLLAVLIFILAGCGGSTIGDITTITVDPQTASLLPNGTKQFSIVQNTFVDWSAPDGGTVSNGLFTAPATTGTYRVFATSILNPLVSGFATVTVANIQVSVSPTSASVVRGSVNTNLFTATVVGTATKTVTWTVEPSGAGTIVSSTPDGNGNARATFTAGNASGLFHIRATSVADPSVSETAQVTILGNSSVGLSPRSASVTTTPPNNSITFTAVLTDANGAIDTTTPLIWDIPVNPAGASLSGAGLRQRTFTAPTNFVGDANCQVRVRTSQGVGATATVQVHSGN